MIITSDNILIALVLWAIDSYLLVVLLRGVLRISKRRIQQEGMYAALRTLADPPVKVATAMIKRLTGRLPASWLAWASVVLSAMVTRQLLLQLARS